MLLSIVQYLSKKGGQTRALIKCGKKIEFVIAMWGHR